MIFLIAFNIDRIFSFKWIKKEAQQRKQKKNLSLKQKRALVQYQVQKIDYYDSRATAKQK